MNECLNINYIVEIPSFDGYFIDMLGNVYSEKLGSMRKMKPSEDGHGYFKINLRKNRKKYTKKIHRLVAETFLRNLENKKQVDHVNGKKDNNRLENLRWVTQSENQKNICKPKNNTSGFLGVIFNKHCNYWTAQWIDFDGKRIRKSFSVKKYGNDKAKQMAINLRKEMEEKFYPSKERYD